MLSVKYRILVSAYSAWMDLYELAILCALYSRICSIEYIFYSAYMYIAKCIRGRRLIWVLSVALATYTLGLHRTFDEEIERH